GLDNLDLPEIRRRGLPVVYAPDAAANSVAEFCLSLMLALSRNLPASFEMGRSTTWHRNQLLGDELFGQTVGLLGYGRIAQRVAVLAHGLGIRVIAWSPSLMNGRKKPLA